METPDLGDGGGNRLILDGLDLALIHLYLLGCDVKPKERIEKRRETREQGTHGLARPCAAGSSLLFFRVESV